MREALKVHHHTMGDGTVVTMQPLKSVRCPGCTGYAYMTRLFGGRSGEFPLGGLVVLTHGIPPCEMFTNTSDDVAMWGGIFEVTRG